MSRAPLSTLRNTFKNEMPASKAPTVTPSPDRPEACAKSTCICAHIRVLTIMGEMIFCQPISGVDKQQTANSEQRTSHHLPSTTGNLPSGTYHTPSSRPTPPPISSCTTRSVIKTPFIAIL